MYKRISTLLLLALLAQTAFAQMAIGGKAVYIGGRVGGNITTIGKNPGAIMGGFGINTNRLKDNPRIIGGFKTGIQAGAILDFPATEQLHVQPGIIFVQQGSRMKWKDKNAPNDVMKAKVTLNYIQIPITVQHKKERIRTTRLIQAGPYVAVGLGGKIEEKYFQKGDLTYTGGWQIHMGKDEKIYDYQKLDFGMSAGYGYQFRSVQAVLTYSIGLKNINMKSSAFSPRVYNSGLSFTLTFL